MLLISKSFAACNPSQLLCSRVAFAPRWPRRRYGGMDDSKLGDSTEDSQDDSGAGGYSGEGKGGEEKGGW